MTQFFFTQVAITNSLRLLCPVAKHCAPLKKLQIGYKEMEPLLIVNFRRRPPLSGVYQFVHQKERPGAHFQSVGGFRIM